MSVKNKAQKIVVRELARVQKDFAETAAGDAWWDSLSPAQKKGYIAKHPNSKYAKKAGAGKPTKGASQKPPARPDNVPTSMSSDPSDHAMRLTDHLDFTEESMPKTYSKGGKKHVKVDYFPDEFGEGTTMKDMHKHLTGDGFKHKDGVYTHGNGMRVIPKANKSGVVKKMTIHRPHDSDIDD